MQDDILLYNAYYCTMFMRYFVQNAYLVSSTSPLIHYFIGFSEVFMLIKYWNNLRTQQSIFLVLDFIVHLLFLYVVLDMFLLEQYLVITEL
jgi:hypothetical protein